MSHDRNHPSRRHSTTLRFPFLAPYLLAGALLLPGAAAPQPWSLLGLAGESLETVAVDPTNPMILFAGHADGGGVSRSVDGGATWTRVNGGLTLLPTTRTEAVAVDPLDPLTVYVGLNSQPNLYRSVDGGASWSAATAGLPAGAVTAVVIDPLNPATVYAGSNGFGVAKSLDGGASWSDASSGLEDGFCTVSCVLDLVLDPLDPQTLYAAVPVLSNVYKTTDGGASWAPTGASIPAEQLALDPVDPQTLLATATLGGIEKTVDGGGVWTRLDAGESGLPMAASYRGITLNPVRPDTVFVDADDFMYRSDDGGLSWWPANAGLEAVDLAELAHTGDLALAATDGGVYRLQNVPGKLRLAQANQQVDEGHGSVEITVVRDGGDDGAVSVVYATADGTAQAASDYSLTSGTLSWADGDDGPRTFDVPIFDDTFGESDETFDVTLSSPTGGAGLGPPSTLTVTIVDNDGPPPPRPGSLGFVAPSFSGGEGDGTVTVTVRRTEGTDGAVTVDYATADGSAEAGSDYAAIAGTLSWADGDAAPRRFSVELLDDGLEEGNETVNLLLSSPTGGAGLGTSSATLTIRDDDQLQPLCVPDAGTLCLNREGRFRARIEWRDFGGNSGRGRTVEIGRRDSGLFYFFDDDNIEMLIKVLDACVEPFNRFWVFYAATTNVEFTLTVTDTATGIQRRYRNELGHPAAPVLDTTAFATCP